MYIENIWFLKIIIYFLCVAWALTERFSTLEYVKAPGLKCSTTVKEQTVIYI